MAQSLGKMVLGLLIWSVAPQNPQPQPAPNGNAQVRRVQRLYTHPHQRYSTMTGTAYVADETGELIVDEDDVTELLERLGARLRR
jgi:hypothetical protein